MHSSDLSPKDERSFSSHDRYYFGPSRLVTKRVRVRSNDGTLDFTITGGNHIQPIQVASVVWNSPSYLQGMRPGDEIVSVNGIPFQQRVNYTKALQILYSTNELDIITRTLRVNSLDATLYDWYDPVQQRTTSPPPGNYLSNDAQLPYFERTVNVAVEKGKRLGLVIRGGAEYGLGIFISGVDKGSLSEQAGLCVGDQILSVNGIDFLHITHSDAVQLLRNIDRMSFHLRQINKLPKPKDNIETNNNLSKRFNRTNRKLSSKSKSQMDISTSSTSPVKPTSWINRKSNFMEKVHNKDNRVELNNLFKKYLQEYISIDQLIKPLLQVLNQQDQHCRSDIIESVRSYVRPNDLDRFDIFIIKDDLLTLKLSHERLMENSLSPSRTSLHSPILNLSKSVEDLSVERNERCLRPQSLLLSDQGKLRCSSTSQCQEHISPLKKTKSLHNIDQHEQVVFLSQSQSNLTAEYMNTVEDFLKDYSAPYPITIHKVRPTLGVAIEGGCQDRVPLPRVVYIQPDGCAYVSSGLRVGHVIVALNGYSMKGLLHREAALFIASSFKDKNASKMDLLVTEPRTDEQ